MALNTNEQTQFDVISLLIKEGFELSESDQQTYERLKAKLDNAYSTENSSACEEFNKNLVIPDVLTGMQRFNYRVRRNAQNIVARAKFFEHTTKKLFEGDSETAQLFKKFCKDFAAGDFQDKQIGEICLDFGNLLPSLAKEGEEFDPSIFISKIHSVEVRQRVLQHHIQYLKAAMLYYTRCNHPIIIAAELETNHIQGILRTYELCTVIDVPFSKEAFFVLYPLFVNIAVDTAMILDQLPTLDAGDPIKINPTVNLKLGSLMSTEALKSTLDMVQKHDH